MKKVLIGLMLVCFSVTAMAQGSDPANPSVPGPAPVASDPAKKAPVVKKASAPKRHCTKAVLDVTVTAEAGSSFTVNGPITLDGDCVIVENPLNLTAKGDGAVVTVTTPMKITAARVSVTDGEKGTKIVMEGAPDDTERPKVTVTAGVEYTRKPPKTKVPPAPLPAPAGASAPAAPAPAP